jgi:polar amino acid transport system permease protein
VKPVSPTDIAQGRPPPPPIGSAGSTTQGTAVASNTPVQLIAPSSQLPPVIGTQQPGQTLPEETTGPVDYVFHFADVWDAREELAWGALLTVELSATAMVLSLCIAVIGAFARISGPKPLRMLIASYVEVIRNTPFLVQIFMLYFGLPTPSLRLDANQVALIALVLNGSAYTIEIVRAGIESIGHGQTEAGLAIGLHRFQVFRFIILPQALRAVVPPLGSQFILLMLNSSIVSVISADELTAMARDVHSRTFRPFETFIVAMVIYLILSLLFTGAFGLIERLAFGRKVATR